MSDARLEPITIRGHTLLCLQGFRGEGYSPAFIENIASIHQSLMSAPGQAVRVVQAPDMICAACPNLSVDGCHLHRPDAEAGMRAQDADVMGRLGIALGETLPWSDIVQKIAAGVKGDDLNAICGGCPWLPLGYCKEGIDGLRPAER